MLAVSSGYTISTECYHAAQAAGKSAAHDGSFLQTAAASQPACTPRAATRIVYVLVVRIPAVMLLLFLQVCEGDSGTPHQEDTHNLQEHPSTV
jgi:hypothetical protein